MAGSMRWARAPTSTPSGPCSITCSAVRRRTRPARPGPARSSSSSPPWRDLRSPWRRSRAASHPSSSPSASVRWSGRRGGATRRCWSWPMTCTPSWSSAWSRPTRRAPWPSSGSGWPATRAWPSPRLRPSCSRSAVSRRSATSSPGARSSSPRRTTSWRGPTRSSPGPTTPSTRPRKRPGRTRSAPWSRRPRLSHRVIAPTSARPRSCSTRARRVRRGTGSRAVPRASAAGSGASSTRSSTRACGRSRPTRSSR